MCMPHSPLDALAIEARACRVCAAQLPLGPRPVFLVGAGAQLMIVPAATHRVLKDRPALVNQVLEFLRASR